MKTDGEWLNAQSARHVVKTTAEHVNGTLNDMEAAKRCGSSREVSRLTRKLSGRRHSRSINPSKDLNGDVLVSQDQLPDDWVKFLGVKSASPDADRNRLLACLTAEEDELDDEELHTCPRPYDAAKLRV